METLVVELLKLILPNTSFSFILVYMFFFGLFLFLLFYFRKLKDYMKNWEKMDPFDRTLFLASLCVLVIVPSFLISLFLTFIVFFFYCIFAPYISGQSADFFKPILLVVALLYSFYLFIKNRNEEIGGSLLNKLFQTSLRWFLISFIVLLIGGIIIISFGIITKCVVT